MVKYPHVKVKLTGTDGNAFALLGRVRVTMQKARIPADEIKAVCHDAMRAGDYNRLLMVLCEAVDVH